MTKWKSIIKVTNYFIIVNLGIKKGNITKSPKKVKANQIKTKAKSPGKDDKRFSLGLKREDIEYSIEGNQGWHPNHRYPDMESREDLCLCEIEPLPNYFGNRKNIK